VSAEDCIRRDYGRSSFVCVCNATYCDTAPNVGSLASGQAIQITSSRTAARFFITNLQFGRKLKHIRAISKPFILLPLFYSIYDLIHNGVYFPRQPTKYSLILLLPTKMCLVLEEPLRMPQE
jgi:hypothetical protein